MYFGSLLLDTYMFTIAYLIGGLTSFNILNCCYWSVVIMSVCAFFNLSIAISALGFCLEYFFYIFSFCIFYNNFLLWYVSHHTVLLFLSEVL